MRHYETIFLLKPTLTEEETKSKIEFFRKLVTDNDGQIAGFDDIGIRQLAYEIKHNKRGYYYVIYFKTSNYKIVEELQRVYRITEDILKFMTVKFEKQTELKAWNDMVNKVSPPQIVKTENKRDTRDNKSDDRRGYKNRQHKSEAPREARQETREVKQEPKEVKQEPKE